MTKNPWNPWYLTYFDRLDPADLERAAELALEFLEPFEAFDPDLDLEAADDLELELDRDLERLSRPGTCVGASVSIWVGASASIWVSCSSLFSIIWVGASISICVPST